MNFEEWLEEEFPCHSEQDFESRSQYRGWLYDMGLAYNAGFIQGQEDALVQGF